MATPADHQHGASLGQPESQGKSRSRSRCVEKYDAIAPTHSSHAAKLLLDGRGLAAGVRVKKLSRGLKALVSSEV
jgi:hypothetical protein